MLDAFRDARRISTPLVAVLTLDPTATLMRIMQDLQGRAAVVVWDVLRGLYGQNEAGMEAVRELLGPNVNSVPATRNPAETLSLAANLPAGCVFFFCNAHRYIFDEQVAQGVWNLRDYFKEDRRTLVLLAPELRPPPELQQDILILDEQLPSDARLQQIILEQYDVAGLPAPTAGFLTKGVDAIRGLAPFSAEQVVAMSLTNKGLNLDQLWSRKRQTIELTRGLTVDRGGETIADIGGSETQTGNMERDATRVAQACAREDERRWQDLLIVAVRRWSCRAASQPDHTC
jgi:hypothetical protein